MSSGSVVGFGLGAVFLLAVASVSGCSEEEQPTISVMSGEAFEQRKREDLKLYDEDKLKINLAAAFRIAYDRNGLNVKDRITWYSPVSGKTSMEIEFASYTLKEGETDSSRWNKACYQGKLNEEDLAPVEEVKRSREEIQRANYLQYERKYFGYICVYKETPTTALSRSFMEANEVHDDVIKAYGASFPEGTVKSEGISVHILQTSGRTPR